MKISLRKKVFEGFNGCSNHGCLIRGPFIGMGTNGQCKCLADMSKAQRLILHSRLEKIFRNDEKS